MKLKRITGFAVFIITLIVVGVIYDNTVMHMLRVNFSSGAITDIPTLFAMVVAMVIPLGIMISRALGSILWLSLELMKE